MDPQTVIVYLYSRPSRPVPLFGERTLALLTEHAAAGSLIEHARFDVLIARRP
ncbi:hypothetical protein [Streptomyces sp. NPDC054834]